MPIKGIFIDILKPDKKAIPTLRDVYEPGPVTVIKYFSFLPNLNFFSNSI